MTTFGTRLREERKARGWPQRKVAAALDIDVATVSRWELGECEPSSKHVAAIAALVYITTKQTQKSLDSFLEDVGTATLEISSTEAVVAHIKGMDIDENVKSTSKALLR